MLLLLSLFLYLHLLYASLVEITNFGSEADHFLRYKIIGDDKLFVDI